MGSEKTTPKIRTCSGTVSKRSTISMLNAFAALYEFVKNQHIEAHHTLHQGSNGKS